MKTLKITLEVECKDSTDIRDVVSDLEDVSLCDNVKHTKIEYTDETLDLLETCEFENVDFEE